MEYLWGQSEELNCYSLNGTNIYFKLNIQFFIPISNIRNNKSMFAVMQKKTIDLHLRIFFPSRL